VFSVYGPEVFVLPESRTARYLKVSKSEISFPEPRHYEQPNNRFSTLLAYPDYPEKQIRNITLQHSGKYWRLVKTSTPTCVFSIGSIPSITAKDSPRERLQKVLSHCLAEMNSAFKIANKTKTTEEERKKQNSRWCEWLEKYVAVAVVMFAEEPQIQQKLFTTLSKTAGGDKYARYLDVMSRDQLHDSWEQQYEQAADTEEREAHEFENNLSEDTSIDTQDFIDVLNKELGFDHLEITSDEMTAQERAEEEERSELHRRNTEAIRQAKQR